MEAIREKRALSQIDADVLVLGIFQDEKVSEALTALDGGLPASFVQSIADECKRESFTGKTGQMQQFATFGQIAVKKIALRGLGKKSELNAAVIRKAAAASHRALQQSVVVALHLRFENSAEFVQAAIEGWILGGYKFLKYKTVEDDTKKPKSTKALHLVAPEVPSGDFNAAATRGVAIAEATNFARDLIAEPASYMTPSRLAKAAGELSDDGVMNVDVLDSKDIEKLGMGAFLGVAKGAKEPPKIIIIRYSHSHAKKTIGLAGKGITFDSGGLSLKTGQGMETMKYDMSGAAAVIGAMRVMAKLQPRINVIAVCPATENMPGGNALHPGDVLKAMNGKTIEVNNTDAEGRLILADALSYLAREKPDEIIDLATLTGAVVTALGRAAAGIMGTSDELVHRITASGAAAGERYWQLPLFDEYKETLKSDIADLKNAGARGEAPSCSAGMFLKEFVGTIPWAHLDIAGPAWLEKDKDELNKGGTAFGVRTLCYYLLNQAE